jgi:hypothetical protein
MSRLWPDACSSISGIYKVRTLAQGSANYTAKAVYNTTLTAALTNATVSELPLYRFDSWPRRLGFPFFYYTDFYTEVAVQSNGALVLQSRALRSASNVRDALEYTEILSKVLTTPIIAALWTRLDTTAVGATVLVYEFDDKLAIQYKDVEVVGTGFELDGRVQPGIRVSFEVVLWACHSIQFNYMNIPSDMERVYCNIGLRSPYSRLVDEICATGTDDCQYNFTLHSNSSIIFTHKEFDCL